MKSLLKKIFPRLFLKQAFLVYNQIKSSTWDLLFFGEEKLPDDFFIIHKRKNPFLDSGVDISGFDKYIVNKLSLWTDPKWSQDQYLVMYTIPGFIEPRSGWGVSLNKRLIYPSLGFASAPHVHKPNFTETYFKKKKVTSLEKIISFRDTGEENYFHFFNDVLAKLFFLQEHGVQLEEYSVVISDKLYAKEYFQYYLKKSILSTLNWHVQQSDEWLYFKSAIFCKPFTHTKKYFDKAVQLANQNIIKNGNRRVFLTRSVNSLRYIANNHEIEPVLKRFNFEIIDSSQLSFQQQIELFSQCRYLVAIHGAGITNVIFRFGNPLSLVEIIQPSSYIPFHYIMMCKLYGYDYSMILGTSAEKSRDGGFIVGAKELEEKITSLF